MHAAERARRIEELRKAVEADVTFKPHVSTSAARIGARGDVFERLHKTDTLSSKAHHGPGERGRGSSKKGGGPKARQTIFSAASLSPTRGGSGGGGAAAGGSASANNTSSSSSLSSTMSSTSSSSSSVTVGSAAATQPPAVDSTSEQLYQDALVRRELARRREEKALHRAVSLAGGGGRSANPATAAAAAQRAVRLALSCFSRLAPVDGPDRGCVDRVSFAVALEAMGYLSGSKVSANNGGAGGAQARVKSGGESGQTSTPVGVTGPKNDEEITRTLWRALDPTAQGQVHITAFAVLVRLVADPSLAHGDTLVEEVGPDGDRGEREDLVRRVSQALRSVRSQITINSIAKPNPLRESAKAKRRLEILAQEDKELTLKPVINAQSEVINISTAYVEPLDDDELFVVLFFCFCFNAFFFFFFFCFFFFFFFFLTFCYIFFSHTVLRKQRRGRMTPPLAVPMSSLPLSGCTLVARLSTSDSPWSGFKRNRRRLGSARSSPRSQSGHSRLPGKSSSATRILLVCPKTVKGGDPRAATTVPPTARRCVGSSSSLARPSAASNPNPSLRRRRERT